MKGAVNYIPSSYSVNPKRDVDSSLSLSIYEKIEDKEEPKEIRGKGAKKGYFLTKKSLKKPRLYLGKSAFLSRMEKKVKTLSDKEKKALIKSAYQVLAALSALKTNNEKPKGDKADKQSSSTSDIDWDQDNVLLLLNDVFTDGMNVQNEGEVSIISQTKNQQTILDNQKDSYAKIQDTMTKLTPVKNQKKCKWLGIALPIAVLAATIVVSVAILAIVTVCTSGTGDTVAVPGEIAADTVVDGVVDGALEAGGDTVIEGAIDGAADSSAEAGVEEGGNSILEDVVWQGIKRGMKWGTLPSLATGIGYNAGIQLIPASWLSKTFLTKWLTDEQESSGLTQYELTHITVREQATGCITKRAQNEEQKYTGYANTNNEKLQALGSSESQIISTFESEANFRV